MIMSHLLSPLSYSSLLLVPFQDAAFRQTIAPAQREVRYHRLLVAVCIFLHKVRLVRGMSPEDQKYNSFS